MASKCERAVIALVLLVSLCGAQAKLSLGKIRHKNAAKWQEKVAKKETQDDIKNFLDIYDKNRPGLEETLEAYLRSRVKDVGIRKLASWGVALGKLLEIGDVEHKQKISDRVIDIGELLAKGYQTKFSYVEQTQLRGWPMYVDHRDRKVTYEAFNFGAIAMAVSKAARALANRNRHDEAAKLLTKVLNSLYDGFLVDDPELSKLDRYGRVVYIPKEASKGRKERYSDKIRRLRRGESECLGAPQAYNHGLLVARAAIAALYAMDDIDWKKAKWSMDEWSQKEAREELAKLVQKNAKWLKSGMWEPDPTGSSDLDRYPGKEGTKWYQWKYRDLRDCKKLQGTHKDRPEDIAHATHETKFVSEYREFIDSDHHIGKEVFDKDDLRKMMVTFLNRIVYDYNGDGSHRFACDVTGTNDFEKNKGEGEAWKQCGGARELSVRAAATPGWLTLPSASMPFIGDDGDMKCDALLMVKTILPLALPGEDFDKVNFKQPSPKWTTEIIRAKYQFYHFERTYKSECLDKISGYHKGDRDAKKMFKSLLD